MKLMIHSLIALSLLALFIPDQTKTGLHELIDFADEYDYKVKNGVLTIKESFNSDQYENLRAGLIQSNFLIDQVDSQPNLENYHRDLDHDISERVTIVYTGDNRELTVNYQLSGHVTKLFENREYYNAFKSFVGTIYTEAMHDYACISLSKDDMIEDGDFLTKLEKNLKYSEIARLEEPDFTVISGNSPHFSRVISVDDQNMNMQISSRKGANGEITFMIGTPLLTTEY